VAKQLSMKKMLAPLLILLAALQTGCQKSSPASLTEYKAYLTLALPASDGPPVDELVLDGTREIVVPINKKDGWPQALPAGPAPVAIRFVDTGKTIAVSSQTGQISYIRLVYLATFRNL
jgi:hypothetical protein